jgi:hypothetical protein
MTFRERVNDHVKCAGTMCSPWPLALAPNDSVALSCLSETVAYIPDTEVAYALPSSCQRQRGNGDGILAAGRGGSSSGRVTVVGQVRGVVPWTHPKFPLLRVEVPHEPRPAAADLKYRNLEDYVKDGGQLWRRGGFGGRRGW